MLTRIVLFLSLVALSLACAPSEDPQHRVIVLGIDGIDPRAVAEFGRDGDLPNLARVMRDGAYAPLPSDHPMLSPILWTTIATGRTPDAHGIGGFVSAEDTDGSKKPVASTQRRVRALWNIASDAGLTVATVGWWATWPAETINGTNVTDRTCFHFLFGEGQSGSGDDDAVISPSERRGEILQLVRRPVDVHAEELSFFADVSPDELDRPFAFNDDLSHLRWAIATADSYRDIGLHLWSKDRPDLLMLYIEGTDSVSHLFGHLVGSGRLAGDLEVQRRRFGNAVEGIYRHADSIVGAFLEVMDDNTTLVILSDHGFKLGELHDDPSVTHDMRRVSDRFHSEDGILYLYGRGVRSNSTPRNPHLVDITPTVLGLLGLPASEEMPGRVLDEVLDGVVAPARIASYETTPQITNPTDHPEVADEMLAHLEALGYLESDEEPTIDRGSADMLLNGGRYAEAESAFRQLTEIHPNDPNIHVNLAAALAHLERDQEALAELDRALELDPTHAKAFFNRGLLLERSGQPEAAAEQYRQTVRYEPGHTRARASLERLTGTGLVWEPETETEAEAHALAVQAGEAARRGDLEGATRLLDTAQELAPDLPMVYDYRANVAYLMGDIDAAIDALERALELEPENAKARKNLEALRARRSAGTN
jgi:Flp pilus assembly protein TadD/predicted AlkP superfamily pyrophosphatase or phosphodiesterase